MSTAAETIFSSIRGYAIRCAIPECPASTADQAPSRHWRTPENTVRAARALGWIHARLTPGAAHVWFCPMHQRWEPGALRWVPAVATEVTH